MTIIAYEINGEYLERLSDEEAYTRYGDARKRAIYKFENGKTMVRLIIPTIIEGEM